MKRPPFSSIFRLSLLYSLLNIALLSEMVSALCTPSRVYDATVTMSIDHLGEFSNFFMPMDPERFSLQYEQEAIDFWSYYYGINVTDGSNNNWTWGSFKVNPNYRNSILSLAVTDPASSQQMARTPISNAFVKNDGFFLTLLEPMMVYGVYGGANGLNLVAGSSLLFGQYRFFAVCDDGTEYQFERTITYRSVSPLTPVNYQGSGTIDSSLAISPFQFEVTHPIWGSGSSIGVCINMPDPGVSSSTMRLTKSVTVMQFPSTLLGAVTDATFCEDIVADNDICVPYWEHQDNNGGNNHSSSSSGSSSSNSSNSSSSSNGNGDSMFNNINQTFYDESNNYRSAFDYGRKEHARSTSDQSNNYASSFDDNDEDNRATYYRWRFRRIRPYRPRNSNLYEGYGEE
jgi:uncharacterized membrane protein YgcG